ncbi:MAG: RICIN domain-containing protein [Hymenobacter sp.]|nr:RICIN domain-containing protein [Hymenobacter sp.]
MKNASLTVTTRQPTTAAPHDSRAGNGPTMPKGIKKALLTVLLAVMLPGLAWSQGFTIAGNELRDANGNNFVMKGINIPLAWFTNDVNGNIANIRRNTNANTLRIVVSTSTPDAAWQTCVQNCIANKMIPMVELHSVTGSNSTADLQRMAVWWASKAPFLTRADISKYVLVNIANEWGDWFMSSPTNDPPGTVWRDAYITAVRTIRNAGINTTIVVDAPGYGQDNKVNTLLSYAPAVQAADPRRNVLFSLHMYCEWSVDGNSTVTTQLAQVKNAGVPIMVGEFGYQHSEGSGTCDINESQIISTCQANGIGWLAWSWKGNGGDVAYLDLSRDWTGASLTAWGNTVVNGSNGTKTAATASVFGAPTTPTTPLPATLANGTYSIVARHSGKALDVFNSSLVDGANVAQYPYGGTNNQKWTVTNEGGGAYSIKAVHSGRALDVNGASTADGARVQQWYYGGGNNQKWRIESVGGGYYRIVSVNSSKCLDVASVSLANGANVQQYTCGGGTNQSFQFNPVSAARSGAIASSGTGTEVYPNPSTDAFTVLQLGAFSYVVQDATGKELEAGSATNNATIGSSLKPGLYIVRIQSEQGMKATKIVKN